MKQFDFKRFAHDLEGRKFKIGAERRKNMSTRKISEETGIPHVTISRALNGYEVKVPVLATLLIWSGLEFEKYIID